VTVGPGTSTVGPGTVRVTGRYVGFPQAERIEANVSALSVYFILI